MIEILLVEDDPVLGRGLSVNLEHEGYRVHWAPSLRDARATNKRQSVELVLLDIGLPDGSGLELLKELRAGGSRIPVILLTARTDEDSVVEGLQRGANDYVKKPFGDRELMARIRNVLREPQTRDEQVRYDELLLLVEKRQILCRGKPLELTPREHEILAYLIRHAELVVTRESMLEEVDKHGELFERTVDSNVSHVRMKLRQAGVGDVRIRSIYGVGYRLEKK